MYGRYMDRINAVYIYEGTDTWTDESGVEWNKVDALTAELKADGYEIISGPRITGDGYYESCIVAVEDNQIEITV